MNFSLKKTTFDDISDILSIAKECGLSFWSQQDYLDETGRPDSRFITALSAEATIIGFLIGRFVSAADSENGINFELYNIGVRPSMQARGVGGGLMNDLIKHCSEKGVSSIWLEVRAANKNAIAFYRSFGFSVESVRRSMYSNPVEDGITMTLRLKDKKNLSLA